jgi:hypothetical protein
LDRTPFELGWVVAGDQQLDLTPLWRKIGKIVVDHLEARRPRQVAQTRHAVA